jgi:hypothetical protein
MMSFKKKEKTETNVMQRLGRYLVGVVISLGIAVPIATATTSMAGATSSSLTLTSPWTAAPFGTDAPSVSVSAGVVSFRGAIAASAGNTNDVPFLLPAAYRPAVNVFMPIDLCGATTGLLFIGPSGWARIEQRDGTLSDANCFTSLDGASFVQTSAVTPLSLIHGWTSSSSDNGTANPAAAIVSGVVHLQGAIEASSPTLNEPFVLPANMTPSVPVFVPVEMCDGTNGRLEIGTDGSVFLREEDQGTNLEDCLTSLDGASFVLHPKNSTALKLKNGWAEQSFNTAPAAAELVKGVVRLQGAINGGSTAVITTLPLSLRPTKDVFVKVDLCDAAVDGRIEIQPTGKVSIQEADGLLTSAQCFTSLDGASFVK